MDLSICILTHNQPELLPTCVGACLSEIATSGVEGEIIVVDNASRDAYPERLLALSPLIRIIRKERNLSFSAANNSAIRASQGRWVLILNDDAFLQEGSLELMLRELQCDPSVGAVGPKLLNQDGSLQAHFTNRRFPHIRGVLLSLVALEHRLSQSPFLRDLLTLDRDPEHSGDADHVAGACLLARRSALESVLLFDERFQFWFEDTDLCYRLKQKGWKIIYLPKARVVHYGSASLNKLDQLGRTALFLRSLIFFYRKNEGAFRCLLLRAALAVVLLYQALWIILHNLKAAITRRDDLKVPLRGRLRLFRLLCSASH